MFRFVKDGADGLSLDEGLDQFLDQDRKYGSHVIMCFIIQHY